MLPDRPAIVFDLDDTLYPYRRFKTSGFVAVAAHLEETRGLDARLGFAALHGASRGAWRGRELQACLVQHDLPAALLPELVDVFRHHQPRLRLSGAVSRMLTELRAEGWRLGVLTNGQASIQARKVAALELEDRVDAVVYATTCGTGLGKPENAPFAEVARRLAVSAARVVFVGNDERCDVEGARLAGMHAVRCDAWARNPEPTTARALIQQMGEVPVIARALLEEASNCHAA